MSETNIKIKEYINSKYKAIDEDMASFRIFNEENNVPLILKETEIILSFILDCIKPNNILELGTAYGYSSLFFAKKCKDASITTIDRSKLMIPIAKESFSKRKEGERINFIEGDAIEILKDIYNSKNYKPFDFVFIDAGKSHYKEFLNLIEKICTKDALIVCDNILMKGRLVDDSLEDWNRYRTNIKLMDEFIDYIIERKDLSVSLSKSGDGLAIIKLNG